MNDFAKICVHVELCLTHMWIYFLCFCWSEKGLPSIWSARVCEWTAAQPDESGHTQPGVPEFMTGQLLNQMNLDTLYAMLVPGHRNELVWSCLIKCALFFVYVYWLFCV
jgi:hypothetical protein